MSFMINEVINRTPIQSAGRLSAVISIAADFLLHFTAML